MVHNGSVFASQVRSSVEIRVLYSTVYHSTVLHTTIPMTRVVSSQLSSLHSTIVVLSTSSPEMRTRFQFLKCRTYCSTKVASGGFALDFLLQLEWTFTRHYEICDSKFHPLLSSSVPQPSSCYTATMDQRCCHFTLLLIQSVALYNSES